MASISQANRGIPLFGLLGGLAEQPAAALGAAIPLSPAGGGSIFEQLRGGAGGGQAAAGGEQALSKEQKESLDQQKKIAEAIEKGDAGRLRDLAKDKKAMAAATPEQKAAMLTALRCELTNKGKDDFGGREALINVLKSAGSDAEYQAMVQAAGGPEILKEAMTTGPGEKATMGILGL